jgi:hypothetical protein
MNGIEIGPFIQMQRDVSRLEERVSNLQEDVKAVRTDLLTHAEKAASNFDNLSKDMQEIKNVLLVRQTMMGMLRLGWAGIWALVIAFVTLLAGWLSGASGWIRLHFFH